MITLNLLPDVKLEYLRSRKLQTRVMAMASLVTLAAVGLVVILAVWVYGGQTVYKGYLTGEITKHKKELKAVPEIDKYLTIQNQLVHLTELHNKKSDFSRVLTYLPQLNPATPNNVTLTKVEVVTDDTGNTMTFQGEVKDYTALNTFRDTLHNAELRYDDDKQSVSLFDSVTVASSSLEKGQGGASIVVFKIQTVYKPEAFLFSTKNPHVVVPHMITTSSAQNAPSVFGNSSTVEKEQ